MPTEATTREIVVPPREPGGQWYTFVVFADDHPTQDENRERRRLGLPLRAMWSPQRLIEFAAHTHLPEAQP